MRQFLIAFTLSFCFLVGCATTSKSTNSNLEKVLFCDIGGIPDMESFKQLTHLKPGSPEYEKARIEYLFERLSKTRYNFIRNGEEYSNARAIIHLRWKYLRFNEDSKTAESFVDDVASGSRMSGKPYLMEHENSVYYLIKTVFHNELDLLDDELIAYHERMKEELLKNKKKQAEHENTLNQEDVKVTPGSAENQTNEKNQNTGQNINEAA